MGGYGAAAGMAAQGLAAGYAAYQQYSGRRSQRGKHVGGVGPVSVVRRHVRTGRKRYRSAAHVFKNVIGGGDTFVWRWQQTSSTYLGPGRLLCANNPQADSSYYNLPLHFMSLTTLPNTTDDYAQYGAYRHGMCVVRKKLATQAMSYYPLSSQDFDGSTGTVEWKKEQVEGDPDFSVNGYNRFFHKYSDIRLNLYGSYTVPIRWNVWLMQLPESLDPLQLEPQIGEAGTTAHTELWEMWRDMLRPSMSNSVATNGRVDWLKDAKILKHHSVTIQPLAYSDASVVESTALGSSTPNIYELRWFVRHDRFRNYKWPQMQQITDCAALGTNGWDVENSFTLIPDVEWGKKLFLFINASAANADTVSGFYATSDSTKISASYDINVRNAFKAFT